MAYRFYVGIDDVARGIYSKSDGSGTRGWVGVEAVARQLNHGWAGIAGVARRLCGDSSEDGRLYLYDYGNNIAGFEASSGHTDVVTFGANGIYMNANEGLYSDVEIEASYRLDITNYSKMYVQYDTGYVPTHSPSCNVWLGANNVFTGSTGGYNKEADTWELDISGFTGTIYSISVNVHGISDGRWMWMRCMIRRIWLK